MGSMIGGLTFLTKHHPTPLPREDPPALICIREIRFYLITPSEIRCQVRSVRAYILIG